MSYKNKRYSSYHMVLTGLFTALTCVATMVIQIPSPMGGYVNLGDCLVLLSAWLLGPLTGALAAGIGSAMADLFSGYAYYAPGTFIIKALMALFASWILLLGTKRRSRTASTQRNFSQILPFYLIAGVCAEVWMVVGYFIYAALLLGNGLSAIASVPGNLVQGLFAIPSAILLANIFGRSAALRNLLSKR